MKKKNAIMIFMVGVFCFTGACSRSIFFLTSPRINSKGGDITITNARVWTGNPQNPWVDSFTVSDGKIVTLNAINPIGRIIDANGALVVPGMHDSHSHIHAPIFLVSPEAPELFAAKTTEEVLKILKNYVDSHPKDTFPRLFGWMSNIFPEGQKPTRAMIDTVVSDRPVILYNHTGHIHWVNTKALELADVLYKNPPYDEATGYRGVIHRNPQTGLATGLLEETEYASTDGILLNQVKKNLPLSFMEQVLMLKYLLDEYSKVGVTSIWAKDGDIHTTKLYETLLHNNVLPVRAVVDTLFTPLQTLDAFDTYKARSEELKNSVRNSKLPANFLRTDVVKLFIDLTAGAHQAWLYEPYSDGINGNGFRAYPEDYFNKQIEKSVATGHQINISTYGDLALTNSLNILGSLKEKDPSRRDQIEHGDLVRDFDLPRFKETGVILSMNPFAMYPDEGYIKEMYKILGSERMDKNFSNYRELIDSGALIVNGSDFPLVPFDPMFGIHILVNGTDMEGNPPGGLWPHKLITVEEALKTYTVNNAYSRYEENILGQIKEGYLADFVMLSENILDPNFDIKNIYKIKAKLTVLNGHVVYKDFTDNPKKIEFGGRTN